MNDYNFPLPHFIVEDKKEVWIACDSTVTAKAIPSLMKRYYPEYSPCLCSATYLEKMQKGIL